MKLNGLMGTGSGKLGNSVFAVQSGEQIVRQYQSEVANPKTAAQTTQRAKFKLASQISAALASSIAFPRTGLTSARNNFTKANFDLITTSNDVASMKLKSLQLAKGSSYLPDVSVTRTTSSIYASLAAAAAASVARVVYNAYIVTEDNDLTLVGSAIVDTAGDARDFAVNIDVSDTNLSQLFVYAYGMSDLNETASDKFANYNVTDGQQLARLVYARSVNYDDYSFTRTSCGMLYAGETSAEYVDFLVTANPYTLNSEIYAEQEGNEIQPYTLVSIRKGAAITCIANVPNGYTFNGWYANDTEGNIGQLVSSEEQADIMVTWAAGEDGYSLFAKYTANT